MGQSNSPAPSTMLSPPLLLALVLAPAQALPAQQRLYQELLENYNPLFIPISNLTADQVQRVHIEANLQKIIDVDTEKGVLTSLIWLDLGWEDDYLKWDPEEYSGLKRLELPPSKVWTPDIFLFNDVTGHFSDDLVRDSPFLVVTSQGHVRWIPPLVVRTMCDLTNSGMEVQRCDLKFGSWVYNADQLDLLNKIDSMDLEGYNPNSQWDLDTADVERHETVYECCPEPFVDITYVIKFHKKGGWILG